MILVAPAPLASSAPPSVSAQTKKNQRARSNSRPALPSTLPPHRGIGTPTELLSTLPQGSSRNLALSQYPGVKIATSFRLQHVITASLICRTLVKSSAICLAIGVLVWQTFPSFVSRRTPTISSALHVPSTAVTTAWWSFGCRAQLWYHRTLRTCSSSAACSNAQGRKTSFALCLSGSFPRLTRSCPLTDFAASQTVRGPGTRSVVAPTSCSSVARCPGRPTKTLAKNV